MKSKNQLVRYMHILGVAVLAVNLSVSVTRADDTKVAETPSVGQTVAPAPVFESSVFLRPSFLLVSGGSGPDLDLGFKKRHLFSFLPEFFARERLGVGVSYKKVSNTTSQILGYSGFVELELREFFRPVFSVLPFYDAMPFFISTQLGVASVEKTARSTVTSGLGLHFLAQLHLPLPVSRIYDRLESEVLLRYSVEVAKVNLVGFSAGINLGFQF
jgi:hypothetical protein